MNLDYNLDLFYMADLDEICPISKQTNHLPVQL